MSQLKKSANDLDAPEFHCRLRIAAMKQSTCATAMEDLYVAERLPAMEDLYFRLTVPQIKTYYGRLEVGHLIHAQKQKQKKKYNYCSYYYYYYY